MRPQKISSLIRWLGISLLIVLPTAASCSRVSPTPTTSPLVSIVSESNPALPGPVSFFASVKMPGIRDLPTGSLTFSDGDMLLGTVTLDQNGLAVFTTPPLAPGTHEISVSYSGDSRFDGAKSGTLSPSVTNADGTVPKPTVTTVAVAPTMPPETEVQVVD
jgi:hypothetical protein